MSYEQRETSRQTGRPVELYLFRFGSAENAQYGVTTAAEPVVYDGVTYEPAPIERDAITTNGRLEEREMAIKVDREDPLAVMLQGYPPSWVISVIIRQGHMPDPAIPNPEPGEAWPVCYVGRVMERASGEGASVSLVCTPSARSMQRVGLRRNYQWACPHALYGSLCQADREAATTTHAITSMPDGRLVLAQFPPTGRNRLDYVGGMIEWDGPQTREYRTILNVFSDMRILVSGPTFGLAVGNQVQAVLGCAHDLQACTQVHNNVQNYGGQPWIPQNNPFLKNTHD